MMKRVLLAVIMQACLLPMFGQKLTQAYKADTDVNPLLPYNLCADPTAVEYDGRLYIYGSNDQLEYNTTHDKNKNTYGKITQFVCMSSADLLNWTFHGVIDVKKASPWIATSWAPSIVKREESDGKTHFYLYYTNTASGIGVLTSTSPTGPWKDPLGHALIDGRTPGRGDQSNIIDPGVCIDDNGDAWLTFGGGDPNRSGTKLMPGNARIVKLGDDMISLKGTIKSIPAPFHFEANELNYINGKYIFSYSGGWSCNASDWSSYDGRGSYSCPGNCSIMSMQTDDPINGKWTYTGEILKNPGTFGYPWGNNHSHMEKFAGRWHMIYHTQQIEKNMGLSGGYRGIAMNQINIKEDPVTVPQCTMTNDGSPAIRGNRMDFNQEIQAECMANGAGITVSQLSDGTTVLSSIDAGDWTLLRSLISTESAKSFTARLCGKGTLEVRTGTINSVALAVVPFDSETLQDVTVNLTRSMSGVKAIQNLYLVFTEADSKVKFDSFHFNAVEASEVDAIDHTVVTESQSNGASYYSLDGRKLSDVPATGLYIRKQVNNDGTITTSKIYR